MRFEVTYDYGMQVGGHYRTFPGNVVGREGAEVVGYGPSGPRSAFTADELPAVVGQLAAQLGTADFALHVAPARPGL
jgi:hypothetical protein